MFDDQADDESFVQQVEVECGIKNYRANFTRHGFSFDLALTLQATVDETETGDCFAALLSDALGWEFPQGASEDTRVHKVLVTSPYAPEDELTLRDNCVHLSVTFENVDMGYAGTGTVRFMADNLICLSSTPPVDPDSASTACRTDVACIYGINQPQPNDPELTPVPGVQKMRACLDPDYHNYYSGRFDGGHGDPDVVVSIEDTDPTILSMTSLWGNGYAVQAQCPFMQARWDFDGGFEYGGWTIGIVADWRAGCGDCVCWSECLCVQKFNIGNGGPSVLYGEICWQEDSPYNEGGGWTGTVSDPDDEFGADTVHATLSCDKCSGTTYLTIDGRVSVPVNNSFSQCPDIDLEIEVPPRFEGDTEYVVTLRSKACFDCGGSLSPSCCEDEPDFPTRLYARPSENPYNIEPCACINSMPDVVELLWTEFPATALPPVYAVVGGAPSERYFAYISEDFEYCDPPNPEINGLILVPCGGEDTGSGDDVPWTLVDAIHRVEMYDSSPCAPVILKFQSMECASDPANAQIDWDVTEA